MKIPLTPDCYEYNYRYITSSLKYIQETNIFISKMHLYQTCKYN